MALITVDLNHRTSLVVVAPTVGVNSMTFWNTSTNHSSLASNSLAIVSGSFVFASIAKGTITGVPSPTDTSSNSYSPLLAIQQYTNWPGSGNRLYVASGVTGGGSVVVSASNSADPDDEITLSVLEVRGGSSITHADVSETPTIGPVTSPSVTVAGAAVLVSWWWGDGGGVQTTLTASSGWTIVHALNSDTSGGSCIQVGCAVRVVTAGTYSCTWTATGPDQGAIVYIAAVE